MLHAVRIETRRFLCCFSFPEETRTPSSEAGTATLTIGTFYPFKGYLLRFNFHPFYWKVFQNTINFGNPSASLPQGQMEANGISTNDSFSSSAGRSWDLLAIQLLDAHPIDVVGKHSGNLNIALFLFQLKMQISWISWCDEKFLVNEGH